VRKTAPLQRVVCSAWMGASETAPMSETLSPKNAEVRKPTFFRDIASLVAANLACAFFERRECRTASFFFAANLATASAKPPATMLMLFRPSITGQPRRAGDSKFKTDPVEALRCNGWFGSFATRKSMDATI
jgi:hypothetical protein